MNADLLIDTHAHLTDKQLADRLDEVLARARDAGVGAVISVATDVATARGAIAQAEGRGNIFATAGIHPHQSVEAKPGDLEEIERLAGGPRVVAVGEIGVDYFYDFSPVDVQHRVFAEQVRIAGRVGKPVIIHSRGKVISEKPGVGKITDPACFHDILRLLDENRTPALTGVFHCFEGTAEQAAAVVERGFYVSFTGSLTFKNNEALRQTVKAIPIDRIMVETDSPYLAPEPHRKVRPNTPAMVTYTTSKLADVLGLPLAEVRRTTTENAKRLFGI